MLSAKYLIVIVGPTAVGKTALSIELAKKFQTEILSADSRQFYREMSIGTAKPSPAELAQAPHHFIDNQHINDYYSVGQYETEVLNTLDEIFKSKDIAVLVGGSGLYVKVVCEGLDEMPEISPKMREELINQLNINGLENLILQLEELDPIYYQQVDKKNPQRILRALEICLSTGKPYSSFRKNQKIERNFKTIKIGLNLPRPELYARIDARMDEMIAQGLLQEAESLKEFQHHNALQTVGYQEIYGFLKGEYDWEETLRLLKRNSRRYAKRQLTWFQKDAEITWFSPQDYTQILHYITQNLT